MENLFFFWGVEDFLINSEIEKLKNKFIDKTFEAMAYKKLYKCSFEDLINAIHSLPMMFGNIMHVIDVNNFFTGDENSTLSDWDFKRLESALQNKSDKNIVIFRLIIPKDSKKGVDARKKIYKIFTKYAIEKTFPLFKSYDKNLIKIIHDLAKNYGLEINSNTINEIISQTGVSLGVINTELQKLAITIYPKTSPSVSDVHEICTKTDDIFIILNDFFTNNIDKALYELKKVFEKKSNLEILAALQKSLRNFHIIKTYYNKIGSYATAQKLNLPENIINNNYKMLLNCDINTIIKLRKNITNAEFLIKTGDCINQEYLIEMALLEAYNNV